MQGQQRDGCDRRDTANIPIRMPGGGGVGGSAALSDETPSDVGTLGFPGSGDEASRYDHVHKFWYLAASKESLPVPTGNVGLGRVTAGDNKGHYYCYDSEEEEWIELSHFPVGWT